MSCRGVVSFAPLVGYIPPFGFEFLSTRRSMSFRLITSPYFSGRSIFTPQLFRGIMLSFHKEKSHLLADVFIPSSCFSMHCVRVYTIIGIWFCALGRKRIETFEYPSQFLIFRVGPQSGSVNGAFYLYIVTPLLRAVIMFSIYLKGGLYVLLFILSLSEGRCFRLLFTLRTPVSRYPVFHGED